VHESYVEKGPEAELAAMNDDYRQVDAGGDGAVSAQPINNMACTLLSARDGHPEGTLHKVVGQISGCLHVANRQREEPGQGRDGARQPFDIVLNLGQNMRQRAVRKSCRWTGRASIAYRKQKTYTAS
jgi:hypothetical protein